MTSRERVNCALSHVAPDRTPLDIGGTTVSSVRIGVYKGLLEAYGLGHLLPTLENPSRKIEMADELLEKLGVDTRTVIAPSLISAAARRISPCAFVNEWGVEYAVPADNPNAYFPARSPFADNASVTAVKDYAWPDPEPDENYAGLREKARRLRDETDCAIIGNVERSMIFEVAIAMRGFEDLLVDMAVGQDFYHALMEKLADIQIRRYERFLEETGEYLDVIAFGDDVGTQNTLLVSPSMYRDLVKPYHKKLYDAIRQKTDAKIFYHSCGNVRGLVEDFIEIGVDILNPVQVAARDMDAQSLQLEFGGRVCFWGAVDTQHTLPFGTPEDVRAETKLRMEQLGKNGGYVVAAVHNIQNEVPVENIIAMCEAVTGKR